MPFLLLIIKFEYGLRLCRAPPAVAGRLVSAKFGLTKFFEIPGRLSTDENDPPVALADADEKDEADDTP